jgi:hypothetical protein
MKRALLVPGKTYAYRPWRGAKPEPVVYQAEGLPVEETRYEPRNFQGRKIRVTPLMFLRNGEPLLVTKPQHIGPWADAEVELQNAARAAESESRTRDLLARTIRAAHVQGAISKDPFVRDHLALSMSVDDWTRFLAEIR